MASRPFSCGENDETPKSYGFQTFFIQGTKLPQTIPSRPVSRKQNNETLRRDRLETFFVQEKTAIEVRAHASRPFSHRENDQNCAPSFVQKPLPCRKAHEPPQLLHRPGCHRCQRNFPGPDASKLKPFSAMRLANSPLPVLIASSGRLDLRGAVAQDLFHGRKNTKTSRGDNFETFFI